MKIAKKRRDVKTKKDKALLKELNEEFKRTDRRDKKQYYNICKDIKDGNRYRKTRKVFQTQEEVSVLD